jgi:hypothetical protein
VQTIGVRGDAGGNGLFQMHRWLDVATDGADAGLDNAECGLHGRLSLSLKKQHA